MSSSVPFTLRQLEYFEAIASQGSLAAAAEHCFVSASALALALDDLERHLGVQLIIRRKGRGTSLTPAGSRVLSLARRLLAGAETLATDASGLSQGLTGAFSLGCFSTLAPFYVPAILEDFGRSHDALQLECIEAPATELHEMLLRGQIETALIYGVDASSQLIFEPVQQIRPYVIVADDHPLAAKGQVRLSDLIHEPLVALDVQPARNNTQRVFESLGLSPTIGHYTSSFEVSRCLVGRGFGYAVLFQRPASRWTYEGHGVTYIELADEVPTTIIGLVRPSAAPRTAKYTALLNFLQSKSGARVGTRGQAMTPSLD
ncbi:LysR family transcriptional regulator [Nesterenkonia haasae]|uniref:LysR family transcriptional regulator n=1 Tax=Nesterenkonia haasae TaxID=2587813 RepID=UPI0013913DE7|nr:LysR family transcriptional regulator [Nesterenkonia haasae]NDK31946.1 LysR family transcriptional regulator [Nesterenkonia haasae]